MDLIKIGKYLAGKRKEHGLTQKELALKLGMSDKSVSKWERGICLPDVSLYLDICSILDISINEFLAGEDIDEKELTVKADENIISLTNDNNHKQKRLKKIIVLLLIVLILAITALGYGLHKNNKRENFIVPLGRDSSEVQAIELLNGPSSAHLYKFETNDSYKRILLHKYYYECDSLIDSSALSIFFDDDNYSIDNGEIAIVNDFRNRMIKAVISVDGTSSSTQIDVLKDVENPDIYGLTSIDLQSRKSFKNNEQIMLLALIYDEGVIRTIDIDSPVEEQLDALKECDFTYIFTIEFVK